MNSTLARWVTTELREPVLDCLGCAKTTKCCAFQPFVPNFLVGGWLGFSADLPSIENIYFHPIGALPTPEYRMSFEAVKTPGEDLLCGFFDRKSRRCGLWEFRPSECGWYFCDDARLGNSRQNLRQRLFDTELAVAQMALAELGLSASEIGVQVDMVNGGTPKQLYPGPELLMMYKKAWNWSQTLSRETVESWK